MLFGIDEAGRGCLAGPVTAACVSFFGQTGAQAPLDTSIYDNFADSKALSPEQRDEQAKIIRKHCMWAVGWAYPREIDKLNIHHATLLAMNRAFVAIQTKYKNFQETSIQILIDGKFVPDIADVPTEQMCAKIKGDTYIPQIQAASIIAKTSRDAYMMLLHKQMPGYGFNSHKGYPTPQHKRAIKNHGVQHFHRRSFKFVRNSLASS